ncbi:MAG TPA: ankyrin repeat domain-containing protein [Gammaproteobacteria bacterium]|jgi:ankyrin repeat protein
MKGSVLALVGLLASASAAAESPLADAIQNGHRAVALELIADGADVNAPQGDGATPLHWAVYKLDPELVERLLDRGANADVENRYGSSPLAEAVKAGNAQLVEMLLDAGADVDSPNLDGETTLMLAARTGSVEVVKLLLDAGADVNARELWREQTALMWAAGDAFPEVVKLLLEHGADPKARAAANDWGAQITSEPRAQYRPTGGLTPLLYAARAGCAACVRAILAAGEDVDRPTPDGVTALMLALDNYEFDTAMVLLDEGANPHYADWWGRTALYLAVDLNTYVPREAAHPRSTNTTGFDVVQRLLAAGVEVDPQLNMHRPGRGGNSARFTDYLLTTGATPLLRAAITHDDETMRALLAAGADVDLPNVMGVTPLMATAGVGVRNINFGANRSPDFEGDPEIEDKVIASLEILLAAGADINARVADTQSRTARIARPSAITDRDGQTALYSAAGRGWARVASFLVEHGAEVDIVDARGRSPLDEASSLVGGQPIPGSEKVVETLRNASATKAF